MIVRSWLPLSIVILDDSDGQRLQKKRKRRLARKGPMARAAMGDAKGDSSDRRERGGREERE